MTAVTENDSRSTVNTASQPGASLVGGGPSLVAYNPGVGGVTDDVTNDTYGIYFYPAGPTFSHLAITFITFIKVG